jgi:uncharacterized iron-regulated membrane protein
MSVSTRESVFYIDGYSGQILGAGSTGVRSFFRSVTDWHRYLAMSEESRPLGKSLTGAANLFFLFIVVSGLFLWLPRNGWSRQSLRQVTWFRSGLSGKARNWNWHNVFGVWAAVPLFFVVLSATVISYPWANDLVYRLTGTEAPAQGGGGQNRNASASAKIDLSGVDPVFVRAEQQVAGWKTISLRVPASAKAPLTFTIDRGTGGQPQLRSTLTMSRDGTDVRLEKFEDQNRGRRTRSWLRFMHTGEAFGIAGQTIAGLASVAGVMLVWTGFALVWSRFRGWFRPRLQPTAAGYGLQDGLPPREPIQSASRFRSS